MKDSTGPSQPVGGSEPEAGAASSLQRIRQELDHLQDSLWQKDKRLAQREKDLRALAQQLEARGRELDAAARRLAEDRRRLEAQQNELRRQERFVDQAHNLEQILARREALLTDRERTMRQTMEELKRQGRDLERQRKELLAGGASLHGTMAAWKAAEQTAKRLLVVIALSTLAAVAVHTAIRPTYLVEAAWRRTDGRKLAADTVRNALADPSLLKQTATRPAGRTPPPAEIREAILRFGEGTGELCAAWHTRQPQALAAAVNALGPATARAIGPIPGDGRSRGPSDEARLLERRDALLRKIEAIPPATRPAATQPAPPTTWLPALARQAQQLTASRRAAKEELEGVRIQLARVQRATTQPDGAPADTASISEDIRQAALAADAEYSRASRRLAGQYETVRALLKPAFAAAQTSLVEVQQALGELTTAISSALRDPPDEGAAAELDAMANETARFVEQARTFEKTWVALARDIETAEDPLAKQAATEAAVREFIRSCDLAVTSLDQKTRALGEGGRQITKRLVVRSALTRTLARLEQARRSLTGRLEAATRQGSFRLEAAVRAALGLREAMRARAGQIDADLRARTTEQMRQSRERQIAELHRREQTLRIHIDELTDSLAEIQTGMQEQFARWTDSIAVMERQLDEDRRRQQLAAELAAIDRNLDSLRSSARDDGGPVQFVPASYAPRPVNQPLRLLCSFLAAAAVLAISTCVAYPRVRSRLRVTASAVYGSVRRGRSATSDTMPATSPVPNNSQGKPPGTPPAAI